MFSLGKSNILKRISKTLFEQFLSRWSSVIPTPLHTHFAFKHAKKKLTIQQKHPAPTVMNKIKKLSLRTVDSANGVKILLQHRH